MKFTHIMNPLEQKERAGKIYNSAKKTLGIIPFLALAVIVGSYLWPHVIGLKELISILGILIIAGLGSLGTLLAIINWLNCDIGLGIVKTISNQTNDSPPPQQDYNHDLENELLKEVAKTVEDHKE